MDSIRRIYIEISESCNAKCPWCVTGRNNRSGSRPEARFMTAKEFEKGIDYSLENNIINKSDMLHLYNWGEPFLNSELNEICGVCAKKGLNYILSTNASVFRKIDSENLRTLQHFIVSLSGFSPETYSRTHGLNFETVMGNILKFSDMLESAGRCGVLDISFLTYKFNFFEIEQAKEYFDSKGIRFAPRLAFYNDFELMQSFLEDRLSAEDSALSHEHIINSLLRKRQHEAIESNAENTLECPDINNLNFDSKWNALPCCYVSGEENWGSLFDMNREELRQQRVSQKQCPRCKKSGFHYIVHNPTIVYGTPSLEPPLSSEIPARLYIDSGSGFSEEETKTAEYLPDGRVCLRFEGFENPPRTLRFDPCEHSCAIGNISVQSESGELILALINADKTVTKDGKTLYIFKHSDPQLLFSVNPPGQLSSAEISFDIIYGSSDIINMI